MIRKTCLVLMATGCLLVASGNPGIASDTERKIENPVSQSIKTRQSSQQAEEKWRAEKDKLTEKFEQLQAEQKQLQQQKQELWEYVDITKARLADKERQLADIQQISSQIQPFLEETLTSLEALIAEDGPFLRQEREKRVANLKKLMVDPEVSISEKYRKTMEAFLVEAEYGTTIETYQETIPIDGQPMLANIFRLGRLSLFYQSLDQQQCGFYNIAEGAWQPLSASNNAAIHAAIDIAAKRRPVEMLTLPVGRMVIP